MIKIMNHGSTLPNALRWGDSSFPTLFLILPLPLLLIIPELSFTRDNNLPSPTFALETPWLNHLLIFLIDLLSAGSGK